METITTEATADWTPLAQDLRDQHAFTPLRVEGVLPSELSGDLIRVGPGLFSRFGKRYGHLFDADGAVAAVRLKDGRAQGCCRVIEGPDLLAERRAGRPRQFAFGTGVEGFPRSLKPKNAANTSVLAWNDRLFALYEPSLPTEFSCGNDIRTGSESDLGGVVRGTFSAHPHYVPLRRTAYNFGLRVLPWGSYLDFYELPDRGPARRLATHRFPGIATLHDFIVTDRHAVFLGSPIRLDWSALMLRRRTISDSLTWRPELGTSVLVVPLDEPARAIRFETEAIMLFHFVNAFERGGDIVLDFVRYPDFARPQRVTDEIMRGSPSTDSESRLTRAVIELRRRVMSVERLWSRTCEFPVVAPRVLTAEHRFSYLVAMAPGAAASTSFPTRLAKVDHATGVVVETELGSDCCASEPVFVPRVAGVSEDDGYLLSLAFDARRGASFLAVVDAAAIEAGPIAKAWFDHPVPMSFHGIWRRAFN